MLNNFHNIRFLSSLRKARTFKDLKQRYHQRTRQLNFDPEISFSKGIFRIQILMLDFFLTKNKQFDKYQVQLFKVLGFSQQHLKTAQKMVRSSKNAEKWPKSFLHISDIAYKDKS